MTGLSFNGKEKAYVSKFAETHYTTMQMSRKYSMTIKVLLKKIPSPDVICPYGNKTRLWERNKIMAILGDGEK